MHRNQFHRLNVMGKYNAGLINGFIMQTLENKYVEMRFWSDFTKEGIPTTNLLSELGVPSFSNLSTAATLRKVQESVNIFNQKFPQGWVLKGLFDLGTENDILSDKTDFVAAVGTYLKSDFETYKKSVNEKYQDLKVAPEYALTSLKEHQGYKGWKILQLLANTKSVMIQERFHIVKEFRVEVVAGQVLGGKSTIDRYGYAFKKNGRWDSSYQHPTKEQIQAAEEYAQKLMNALPSELRGMTFGLDVAITNEGKAVLIESNPGGNSNFLYEEEPASTKELTRFLLKFPSLVKSGKISPGLSPRAQMHFIKRKFAEWAIDSATLYPGMSFLEDRIEDPEFKRLPPVSRESNRQAKHSIPFEVGRCKASLQN